MSRGLGQEDDATELESARTQALRAGPTWSRQGHPVWSEGGAMMTRRTFVISSKLAACGALLLTLTQVAMASTISGRQVKRSSGSDAPRVRGTAPADAAVLAKRQRFLEMFARA